ncbi:hypothetical protein [Streptomyces sp. NPDC096339]|uniref:hypothetical protein n=1 Tax=Streptomyces sp. NPDC096339 TaxID=3366086 RepID=UPI00380C207E
MSERAFDPQDATLPNAVQLEGRYDAARMRAELAAFAAGSGTAFGAAGGRRVLPLRSPGGDPRRTDAGGPNVHGFRATPWLRRLPYFGKVIDSLPGPVRGARLWATASSGCAAGARRGPYR